MTHKMIMKIALSISAVALIIALAFTGCGGSSSSSGSSAPTDARGISDTAFGTLGVVTTTIETSAVAYNLAIQPDGKIVAGGYANDGFYDTFALARYTITGTLDTGFGTAGVVTTAIGANYASCKDVIIQSDSRIIAAGYASDNGTTNHFALARYTITGTLDTSFGISGVVTTTISTNAITTNIALQSDNKIVAAGYSFYGSNYYITLVRYTSAGALDTGFGINGIVTSTIGAKCYCDGLAIQPDGKIVAGGYSYDGTNYYFALARYTSTGALDATFGGGAGVVTSTIGTNVLIDDEIYELTLQPDGKIVAAGFSYDGVSDYYGALARYNANGAIDTSFGASGVVTITIPTYTDIEIFGIALQSNGKIVITGYASDGTRRILLARYNSNGALDTGFGAQGIILESLSPSTNSASYATAIQSDGEIVVGGYANFGSTQFALVRYK